MDKQLVNRQIINMRKVVRNAKHFSCQRILRQLKKMKQKLTDKQNEKIKSKILRKISSKQKELIAIKNANNDEVSKFALINDCKQLLQNSNLLNEEEKVFAIIGKNDNVVKVVEAFKRDNTNSELWMQSLIELWQQTKRHKRDKIFKNKNLMQFDKQNNNLSENNNTTKTSANSIIKSVETETLKRSPNIENDKVIKKDETHSTHILKIKARKMSLRDAKISKRMNGRKISNVKPKRVKDNSFIITPKLENNTSENKVLLQSFTNLDKQYNNNDGDCGGNDDNDGSGDDIHPSWKAKQQLKQKHKIIINEKSNIKKIFDN